MKTLGWILFIIGLAGIPLGFYLQAQQNASAAADMMFGYGSHGSPAPWIVGIGGVVLLLVGLVLLVTAHREPSGANTGMTYPSTSPRPAVSMGWHDDPESPSYLRYHDGVAWTDRRVLKTEGTKPS